MDISSYWGMAKVKLHRFGEHPNLVGGLLYMFFVKHSMMIPCKYVSSDRVNGVWAQVFRCSIHLGLWYTDKLAI